MPASLRISADAMNLLEQMLKADPAERITLGRIREHPWFLVSLPIELQARRDCRSDLGHNSVLVPASAIACLMPPHRMLGVLLRGAFLSD